MAERPLARQPALAPQAQAARRRSLFALRNWGKILPCQSVAIRSCRKIVPCAFPLLPAALVLSKRRFGNVDDIICPRKARRAIFPMVKPAFV